MGHSRETCVLRPTGDSVGSSESSVTWNSGRQQFRKPGSGVTDGAGLLKSGRDQLEHLGSKDGRSAVIVW